MSPKLPVVSGEALVRALGKFGYVTVRQKAAMYVCGIQRTLDALLLPFLFIPK